jgi:hypothetical protein
MISLHDKPEDSEFSYAEKIMQVTKINLVSLKLDSQK